MKKIAFKTIFTLIAAIVVVIGCQDNDLPEANFSLGVITNIDAVEGHEKVTLSWAKPVNDTPEGYRISWVPDGEQIDVASDIASYEITGLETEKNYTFSIQATYGSVGISGKTEIDVSTPDQLNFNVFPGDQFAIAKWEKPDRTDITGYLLSWIPGGETPIELGSDITVYQITGLENNVEYTIDLKIVYDDEVSPTKVALSTTPGEVSPFTTGGVVSPMSTEEISFAFNPAFLPQSIAVSWVWNFGDTNTSTSETPKHTYTAPGKYTIELTVTDNQGFTFITTSDLYVWGEKWAYDLGAQIKTQSPAIASDGTIYIGSENNTSLHAINPNGTLKWTYDGFGDNTYSSASIGSDGTIYIGSKDDNLHAINPDGTQKWKSPVGSNVIYSTPAIAADGTVYIGSDDDNLYAFNTDGTEKWKFAATENFRSSPAIGNDGTIYAGSDDDNLYAINPDGSLLWSFPVGGNIQSGVSIDTDGTIIVGVDQGGSSGVVFAINPDGTEKWSISVTGRISVCSPALANGTIYVGTKEGNNLLALNAVTGTQVWSFSTPGAIVNSSPAVDKNGVIYFGSWDNHVYAINPDGTLKYKFLTGGDVWSSPAIGSDGTIYIGSYDNKLHALEMFAEGLADDAWPMFGKDNMHTSR
ncbi:MAG: PQQ-binding-like beta-propeller repeat protein [Labilibaculum sp.]|nr:PQQ-binding-like beta-propeller repeat protein [Labilibaculum sp.]